MDLGSIGTSFFWVTLAQIMMINIVLSGDNAVVIAMACRGLPPDKQRPGMVLGALVAIVLRRSRLHGGLVQRFLVLFALLAILAPTFDAPAYGNGFEEYVSAPADTRGDAATLVGAALSIVEDLEEDGADQADAALPALAAVHCTADAGSSATEAWHSSFPRLSGNSCTGPPTL